MSTVRHSFAVTTAVVAAAGLAACSSSSGGGLSGAVTATPTAPVTAVAADPALAGLVGPGCAAYAAQVPDGSGSVAGMATDPLVTAASNNPLLKTLTKAVSGKLNKKTRLVDTLNGGDWTVFAPVDSAFAKLPAKTTKKLASDGPLLTKVLTYHVLAGRITPKKLGGTHKTVEGNDLKVTGPADALQVNGANVICGGIRTANATVYLIDTVLSVP